MSDSLLSSTSLCCDVAGIELFKNISFDLRQGGLIEISGRNGSGKSTLLRCLVGIKQPSSGALRRDVNDCVYLGHKHGLHSELTIFENLRIAGSRNKRSDSDRIIRESLERLNLFSIRHKRISTLSAGLKQRSALARIWSQQKSLWFLDEPGSTLDSESLQCLKRMIQDHRSEGGGVVIATHTTLGLVNTEHFVMDC